MIDQRISCGNLWLQCYVVIVIVVYITTVIIAVLIIIIISVTILIGINHTRRFGTPIGECHVTIVVTTVTILIGRFMILFLLVLFHRTND